MDPVAFQDKLWMTSACFRDKTGVPAATSQILTLRSPEAEARILSAEGLNRTWPTFLEWPVSLATGGTSAGSSASVYKVKPSGTCQIMTFPSSEAEATMRSLKGFLDKEREC